MAQQNPIVLDKPEDWPLWIEDIQGDIPDDIWELIDPEAEEEDQVEAMDEPSRPEPEDVNPNKTSYFELTANERTVLDQAFKHYQVDHKKYEQQKKGLQEAKTRIKGRVSNAKRALLKGRSTAKEWLETLKKACSVSKTYILQQVSERYQSALRKQPTLTTLHSWLAVWELAMAEATHHKVAEIENGKWLRDLAIAISSLSDALRIKFIKHSGDEVKSKPDRYLEVSAQVREMLNVSNMPKPRVLRGNTFAADLEESDADEEDKGRRGRKRAGTETALQEATDSKKKKEDGCKACGQTRHKLSRCYYAFPELRYKGFKPIKKFADQVSRALECNKDLAKEIEAIRKARQAEESEK